MSALVDLLGRRPVMRPIVGRRTGERPAFGREVREGVAIAHVPYATTTSSAALTMPVSLPAMPWEVSDA
ncbi:hypothetical protein [Salipiger abyssi]|uniref:Uncharacterized protein n=1 Tax=Salipiger abyssi TaxID=1250539 RepID=A0A1P8UWF4_9RHOB|nr:hypothetical protein [Salipiger abyssi]APZ53722.1 hypothetical protein Ga0080574_TMP3388 [Salipiger abyssi]